MVSIKTVLTLGGIATAIALFVKFGGASGIGSKIGSALGGGFSDFGSSIVQGFQFGLGGVTTGGASGAANVNNADTILTGKSADVGLPLLAQNANKTKGVLDDFNRTIENIISGSIFNPNSFETAPVFTENAITRRLTRQQENAETQKFPFGGHQNAIEQERALQFAIIQSKRENPQFFR